MTEFGRSHRLSGTDIRDWSDADDFDLADPAPPKRDWKKVFLICGLGALSWVATYVGMLELIQSNMGALSFVHKVVIGFSVAMLMTMIIWLLDQMFAPLPLTTKLAYIVGYLFLTLISVGFGFGFYWKVLESRSEASRSAESAVSQVQAALFGASARMDQLRTTLDQLHAISTEKAILEREKGTSCPNSRPGDGPRRRLRDADAARFSFAANFVKSRSGQVKADMRALDADLKKITSGDRSIIDPKTGTRNKYLQGLTRRLELVATGFNAFRTDPQLRQIRSELADRSTQTVFPTGRGNATFSCPDPQLQSALRGVVRAIDQLPELGKPEIATVEGAQAVVEAFRRLTATLYGIVSFRLPPSADELRALQQKAVQSVERSAAARQAEIGAQVGGLSKRDYIPLAIAVFVDLCLFLVSIGRPMNRLNNLIPKMREAERGPVFQILSRFDDIHRDADVREKFELFRHVVFDFNGDYYVAVPLDAPRRRNPEEVERLQLEAHLLANLFASFEKEKIFSRVYNPLLSRKMIERKLERQGSKFATSTAFRIYRFKDGAWSDIILGAVMGAARRAHTRRQAEGRRRGPELPGDLEAPTPQPPHSPTRAPDEDDMAHDNIRAAHAGSRADSAVLLARPGPAWGQTQRAHSAAIDPVAMVDDDDDDLLADDDATIDDLRSQYGPYADRFLRGRLSRYGKPDQSRWPYQRPPEPISEAAVDVEPRNAPGGDATDDLAAPARAGQLRGGPQEDAAPSGERVGLRARLADPEHWAGADADADASDNVIPMPNPRPSSAAVPTPADDQTQAAETEHDETTSDCDDRSAPTYALEMTVSQPIAMHGPHVNIRLTERTAEVSLPVTMAAADTTQSLETASVSHAPLIDLVDSAVIAVDGSQSNNLEDLDANFLAITEALRGSDFSPDTADSRPVDDAEVGDESETSTDASDPFLRVAERFAAKRPTDG